MKNLQQFLVLLLVACCSLMTEKVKANENDNQDTVRFHVFTSNGQNKSFDVVDDLSKTKNSFEKICDSSKPLVKLITHGFAETWNMTNRWDWFKVLKSELFKSDEAGKLCVIAVDWKELANGAKLIPNYWSAISNMNIASNQIVDYLVRHKIPQQKHMHCVGFSLGAHMCGMLYKTYTKRTQEKLDRITGLDPAGPFYGEKPTSERLYHTDAKLVDVIHTSKDFGIYKKSGHMDFYPSTAPSKSKPCDIDQRLHYVDEYKSKSKQDHEMVILYEESGAKENVSISSVQFKDIDSLDSLVSKFKSFWQKLVSVFYHKPKRYFLKGHQFFGCTHLMAMRYFIHSVNDCVYQAQECGSAKKFWSKKCNKVNIGHDMKTRMGYWSSSSDPRVQHSMASFYVNTTDTLPFCQMKIKT